MQKNIKYITGSIVVLLLIGGFIFWLKQPSYFEMNGNLVEVKNNSFIISGGFNVDNGKNVEPQNFEIKVSDNTKITRRALVIPTDGLPFKVDELEREEKASNLSSVKADLEDRGVVGVELTLTKNIFGKPKMTASEILFISAKF